MFREKRQSDVGGFTGRGVWHTLLWGALVGTIFSFVLTGLQFAVLKALGEPLTPPPLVGVLALVSPFLVGLTTGIVSHLLLARIGWVPRLTWLLLAFLNWVVVPLGTPLIAALLELFLLALFGQKFLASQPRIFAGLFGFVAPIFGFGAWLILARLVVVAVAISPKAGDESIGRRPALAIAGMYFLALFVAAS